MKFNNDKFESLLSTSKSDFFDEVDAMIDNESDRLVNAKIAMRLFDYMEENSVSRKQLAEKLEISTQYLSRILTGKVNITIGKAVSYGNRLGIILINIPEVSSKPKIKTARMYKMSSISRSSLSYSVRNLYPLS